VEWLVQIGDLDVMRVEAGANSTSFAGFELNQAFAAARASSATADSDTMQMEDFLREFSDLIGEDLPRDYLFSKFMLAAKKSLGGDPCAADFGALYETFRESSKLMRALVKKRLFSGTLSAGGGSSQVAIKDVQSLGQPQGSLRSIEVMSLPLGNKAPLLAEEGFAPLWPADKPLSQDMISAWQEVIAKKWKELDDASAIPSRVEIGMRGLLVGISAVYHASKFAGCSEMILSKASFLSKLQAKLDQLLENPPAGKPGKDGQMVYDHKNASNLVLAHEVAAKAMAPTAWIVCKRNWKAQPTFLEALGDKAPELPEYAATWVLGLYLIQTGMV